MLRELFNERKWRTGDLDRLGVTIRHRGAPGDERVVLGAEIVDVRKGGLVVAADPTIYGEGDEESPAVDDGQVFIPYHRILRVTNPGGVLWVKPS